MESCKRRLRLIQLWSTGGRLLDLDLRSVLSSMTDTAQRIVSTGETAERGRPACARLCIMPLPRATTVPLISFRTEPAPRDYNAHFQNALAFKPGFTSRGRLSRAGFKSRVQQYRRCGKRLRLFHPLAGAETERLLLAPAECNHCRASAQAAARDVACSQDGPAMPEMTCKSCTS